MIVVEWLTKTYPFVSDTKNTSYEVVLSCQDVQPRQLRRYDSSLTDVVLEHAIAEERCKE